MYWLYRHTFHKDSTGPSFKYDAFLLTYTPAFNNRAKES